MLSNESCENSTHIHTDGNPVVSTVMFILGVMGNVIALAILGVHQKERRTKSSIFCILVTGLAMTDLLGTCFLSPLVFVCYIRQRSLLGLTGDQGLCGLFAFAMTFFGLASMLILCAMAVERCLAISHPYFYSKCVRRSFAKVALLLIYIFTCVFCVLPFFGFGRHKQYCPGTWCFIKMEAAGEGADEERKVLAFSLSYASVMALLIVAVFVCNGSVIVSLCRMHRSQMTRRGSVVNGGRKRKMSLGWFGQGEEEMDHLMLLASMTVIFVVCSLPLTRCVLNLPALEDWIWPLPPFPEGRGAGRCLGSPYLWVLFSGFDTELGRVSVDRRSVGKDQSGPQELSIDQYALSRFCHSSACLVWSLPESRCAL
ncbi:unnamed protein product [Coregonus sp. 'balchen']|nr:unnamed protein product [Coregonus sp. 'balchen']